MANPFKAVFGLLTHHDKNEKPTKQEPADSASYKLAEDVYKLQIEKRQKAETIDLHSGKSVKVSKKHHESDKQPIDNSRVLALSKEERQERFEHAAEVKLGQPWNHLAHQIAICREDYVDKHGNEDPGYYRRRRFKRQTEVHMNELPTDKFYFQVQVCARTAISKNSLNEFAGIAEYYGFGVKENPIPVFANIDLLVKQKEAEDNESIYYGGEVQKGFSDDPNYCMLGIKLEDGSLYRFTQTQYGQKTFRDKDGLWLCTDSKEAMKPEAFLGQKHSWVLYKQNQNNPDLYLSEGAAKQFTLKLGDDKESLIQVLEDGTEKEITSNGIKLKQPVKSGS